MQNLTTILMPVDFSPRSAAALPHLQALCQIYAARPLFLHVVPEVPEEYAGLEALYHTPSTWPRQEELERSASDKLSAFVEISGFGEQSGQLVMLGEPAQRIIECAESQRVEMIVMPTHGYGNFRRFVLGSVTTKVLHDANCPVFTGAHLGDSSADFVGRFQRVACAVGLRHREHSIATLRWAAGFCGQAGASLTVLHAAKPRQIHGLGRELLSKTVYQGLLEKVKAEIEDLIVESGADAEIRIGEEDLISYICSESEKLEADLLVIGRSIARGIGGRLRTRAYNLIRESLSPVVSI